MKEKSKNERTETRILKGVCCGWKKANNGRKHRSNNNRKNNDALTPKKFEINSS